MIRNYFICLLLAMVPTFGFSQLTPQPSPGASVSQTIGVTEIYVEYSRPSVKGRNIFGNLVPYGEIWRTGANASTKFEISNAIHINGLEIKPGVYALMTRPGRSIWEVYLVAELDVTEPTFATSTVLYSFLAKASPVNFTETFTVYFSDLTDETANLRMQWENIEVVIPIVVNNSFPVENAIEIKSDEMAGNFQQAAEYFLQKNEHFDLALDYIEKSILLRETFRNNWIKAQILYAQQQYKSALVNAKRAKELGTNDPVYEFFSVAVDATIADLQKKTL